MSALKRIRHYHSDVLEYADEYLSGKHTTETISWEDDSFQIEVYHTVAAYEGYTFREALFFDSGEEVIEYREYILGKDRKRRVIRSHEVEENY